MRFLSLIFILLSFLGVKAQAYVKIHPKGKIKVQNIPRAKQISFDTIFYEVVEYKEGALTILVDSMNRYVNEIWVTKRIGMDSFLNAKKSIEDSLYQIYVNSGRAETDSILNARVTKHRDELKKRAKSGELWIGMRDHYAEMAKGFPIKINRTQTKYMTSEQWVYNWGYLYFEDGKLTTIQN